MKATWNGTVIAQSDDIVTVEGNAYFPAAGARHHTALLRRGPITPGDAALHPG
jgi:hypothetical protein